ncbi:Hypothetical predicted protein [Olea europaea subsp. europaea]|uniref:Uncharacterized protein n=1 Tax=Olea europaea subsp. europaea TaxID=158383 RepID=A0A8S0T1E4_OLEEU|nr:Hypothetical predicted protein [Olea europaea subsp. europaea]
MWLSRLQQSPDYSIEQESKFVISLSIAIVFHNNLLEQRKKPDKEQLCQQHKTTYKIVATVLTVATVDKTTQGGGNPSITTYELLQSYDFPVPEGVTHYDLDKATGNSIRILRVPAVSPLKARTS